MNPSESWWGLLLSGLVGSIIGGVATFLAVWLAIRHDRLMRREDRLGDAVAAAYAAAGRFGSAMQAADGVPDEDTGELFEAFFREASLAIAAARHIAPGFTEFLNQALEAFAEDPSNVDAYLLINSSLHHWISNPKQFEDPRFIYEFMRTGMPSTREDAAGRP